MVLDELAGIRGAGTRAHDETLSSDDERSVSAHQGRGANARPARDEVGALRRRRPPEVAGGNLPWMVRVRKAHRRHTCV